MTTTGDTPTPVPVIRPATVADVLAVARLEQRCFSQPWPYLAFRKHLDVCAFLVAVRDGRVVGFVIGDIEWNVAGNVGHIKDLAVAPSARREGIGERLLRAAMTRLEAAGVTRISLEVRESNDGARQLYHKLGFRRAGQRERYYQDGERAIVLTCRVNR